MDATNRRAVRCFEYLEPLRQSPLRTASGMVMLAFLDTLYLAAYYDEDGLSLGQILIVVAAVPTFVGIATAVVIRARRLMDCFDPQESLVVAQEPTDRRAGVTASSHRDGRVGQVAPVGADGWATVARRGERARDNVFQTMYELGELAPLVRQLDDDAELAEVLDYVDSLRATLSDSDDVLRGVVDGHGASSGDRPTST